MPKYFILFIAMVNRIFSLISLSASSLLVYRNATDYCIVSCNFNVLYYFYQFLVESLVFSLYKMMSLINSCSFTFPVWMPFISWACPQFLATWAFPTWPIISLSLQKVWFGVLSSSPSCMPLSKKQVRGPTANGGKRFYQAWTPREGVRGPTLRSAYYTKW